MGRRTKRPNWLSSKGRLALCVCNHPILMNIRDSRKAARFLRRQMKSCEVEEFWVIALNPSCDVIACKMLFRGTVDSCFIHPRDIFRFALLNNASSLLVGHNHPSGSFSPSAADQELTCRLREAGKLLQIPLVDHIIIGREGFFSFAQSGW